MRMTLGKGGREIRGGEGEGGSGGRWRGRDGEWRGGEEGQGGEGGSREVCMHNQHMQWCLWLGQ